MLREFENPGFLRALAYVVVVVAAFFVVIGFAPHVLNAGLRDILR
jgi:hypothetical protein